MGRPPLTEEQRAEARARIADAAIALYAEGGLKAASMRAIARRLEVAPSWLYLHHSSHYDLLTSVWRDALAGTLAELRRIASEEADPVRRLRRVLQGYADFAIDNPVIYQNAFMIMEREADMPTPRPKSAMAPFVDLLIAAIDDARAAGRIPDMDSALLAQTLWAAVHGTVGIVWNLARFDFVGQREMVTTILDLALARFDQ